MKEQSTSNNEGLVMDWLVGIGFFLASAFVVVAVLASIVALADAHVSAKRRGELDQDLRAAITHSQPNWHTLVELAQLRHQGRREVYQLLMEILRDVLKGLALDLKPHQATIEQYIEEYRKTQPFEGLPGNTRIHLSRIRDALGANTYLLEPLTDQIRELVSVYELDKRRQRRYSTWGFAVGLIGLLFAALAYFVPYNPQRVAQVRSDSLVVSPDTSKK